jgi:hypothetical protein
MSWWYLLTPQSPSTFSTVPWVRFQVGGFSPRQRQLIGPPHSPTPPLIFLEAPPGQGMDIRLRAPNSFSGATVTTCLGVTCLHTSKDGELSPSGQD